MSDNLVLELLRAIRDVAQIKRWLDIVGGPAR